MAAEAGILTEQANGGQTIDISSAADVHIVPSGETHFLEVYANLAASGDVTIKVDGESTGVQEACEAKKTRCVFKGAVTGNASTSALNLNAGATGRAWGVYRKLA